MEQLHRHFFQKYTQDIILVKIKLGVQVKDFSRNGVCEQVVKYFEIFFLYLSTFYLDFAVIANI